MPTARLYIYRAPQPDATDIVELGPSGVTIPNGTWCDLEDLGLGEPEDDPDAWVGIGPADGISIGEPHASLDIELDKMAYADLLGAIDEDIWYRRHPGGEPLGRADVATLLDMEPATITRYLDHSQPGGRYADHPFPKPSWRVAGNPCWTADRCAEIRRWKAGRTGRTGRPRRGALT